MGVLLPTSVSHTWGKEYPSLRINCGWHLPFSVNCNWWLQYDQLSIWRRKGLRSKKWQSTETRSKSLQSWKQEQSLKLKFNGWTFRAWGTRHLCDVFFQGIMTNIKMTAFHYWWHPCWIMSKPDSDWWKSYIIS